jgi:hypothetical protein
MIRQEFMETVLGAPPEGWTMGYLTLDLNYPKERIPVEAWRRGAFAIHEGMNSDGKIAILSHAPTGLRINAFATMDEAAECAEKIEPFTDWNAITKKFETGSDLYPKVRDAVEEIKNRSRAHVSTPGETQP